MLKILIVEDEYLIRVGVRSSIDWEQNGFVLLDDAVDGVEAYEKIKKYSPDILLLDIRMPKLNGLQLLQSLKEEAIEVCTIILSCMEDFETVRAALRYGVFDYSKKESLNPKELLEILIKAKAHLKQNGRSCNSLPQQLSYPEKILNTVLDNASYELTVRPGCFIYIKTLQNQLNRSEYVAADICRQMLKNLGIQSACRVLENGLIMLCVIADIAISNLASRLQLQLKSTINMDVSCCMLGVWKTIAEAYELHSLKHIKNIFFYLPFNENVVYERLPHLKTKFDDTDTNHERNVLEKVAETNNKEEILQLLEGYINYFYLHKNYFQGEVKNFFVLISDLFFSDSEDILKRASLQNDVLQASNLDELSRAMQNIIDYYFENQSINTGRHYSPTVLKALEYISDNQYDYISLSDVSKHVALSEPYLSTLFKKETGKTLISYVRDYKLKLAKNMLKDQQLVYEVADQLGYQNSNYFAKIFKKSVGISPEKYKEQYKNACRSSLY